MIFLLLDTTKHTHADPCCYFPYSRLGRGLGSGLGRSDGRDVGAEDGDGLGATVGIGVGLAVEVGLAAVWVRDWAASSAITKELASAPARGAGLVAGWAPWWVLHLHHHRTYGCESWTHPLYYESSAPPPILLGKFY